MTELKAIQDLWMMRLKSHRQLIAVEIESSMCIGVEVLINIDDYFQRNIRV